MSKSKITIGEKIDDLIKKNDLTSKELSKRVTVAGVKLSEATLSDIINNVDKGYSYKIFVEIAKQLNVSLDYLLTDSDVFTTDNELKFVCEYTGLNEDAVKHIRNMKTDFVNEVKEVRKNNEYMKILDELGIAPLNKSTYNNIINNFISSDCFEKIIETLFNEINRLNNYLNSISTIVYDENFNSLKPLAEFNIEMFLSYWFDIRQMAKSHLIQEHKFNLFILQESIIDYAKFLATDIDDFDEDYSNSICSVLYEVKKTTDFYEEHPNEYDISDKKLANKIINEMNKSLKKAIKKAEKSNDWI